MINKNTFVWWWCYITDNFSHCRVRDTSVAGKERRPKIIKSRPKGDHFFWKKKTKRRLFFTKKKTNFKKGPDKKRKTHTTQVGLVDVGTKIKRSKSSTFYPSLPPSYTLKCLYLWVLLIGTLVYALDVLFPKQNSLWHKDLRVKYTKPK